MVKGFDKFKRGPRELVATTPESIPDFDFE
jgi:hypothetical protein